MWDKVASIIGSIFTVALATTLVLPGRQTPQIAREGFTGLSKVVSASIGK